MATTQYISSDNSGILSDPILDYISRILMEAETDENFNGYQEAPNLQDTENFNAYHEGPDLQDIETLNGYQEASNLQDIENFNGYQEVPNLQDIEKPFYDILEQKYPRNSPEKQPISTHLETYSDSANSPSKSFTQESGIESLSTLEFQRGVKEGMEFLPVIDTLVHDSKANTIINNTSSTGHKLDGSSFINQMAKTQYNSLDNEVLSDPILDYINWSLLEEEEEEIGENCNGYQEAVNLHDIEKPFYDILEQKYPPNSLEKQPISTHLEAKPDSADSPSKISTQESGIESLSTLEFQRGVEEGMKFLPSIDKLAFDLQANTIENNISPINHKLDEKESKNNKGKKNNGTNMDLLEGQNRKLPMLSNEGPIRDDTFDQVLLYHGESHEREEISSLHEKMRAKANSIGDEEIHVNLGDLLVSCANAVAISDHKMAYNLIKDIRKHASPNGDKTQRLVFVFTNALEARLAGSGSESYRHLITRPITTAEILKSFHLYVTASPFNRVSYFFANNAILRATEGSSKIHIIDLGIFFGFQWPSLIQSLANNRKGEISKLRITGVDFPQPGFRPAQRVEDIGRRLKNYAESFDVPFEYQGIASKWEEIRIEDLKIEKDEVLIVNSLYQLSRVKDEAFGLDSPRNQVLNLIHQIKPRVFIQGVFNATFSPFFVTRFRQTLSYYSSVFDIFDTKVPREDKYREFVEQGFLSCDIMNVIACEGSDWVHRPETYKQWHARNLRAGFEQSSLEPDIVKVCKEKVRNFYDSRFFIEKDGNWLLQGWKGRVMYALSMWKPKLE